MRLLDQAENQINSGDVYEAFSNMCFDDWQLMMWILFCVKRFIIKGNFIVKYTIQTAKNLSITTRKMNGYLHNCDAVNDERDILSNKTSMSTYELY